MRISGLSCSSLLVFGLVIFCWASSIEASPLSTKICQLTGLEDRGDPGQPTGIQRGGVPSTITGTDIGFPFEHGGFLRFLFGDTREFPPDECEPDLCGTAGKPIPAHPETVQRWPTQDDWDAWTRLRGDGWDNIASAPLSFDPEQCIPLALHTELWANAFAHATTSTSVSPAIQLAGAKVASRPEDKRVLVMGNRILVIRQDGAVFAHDVVGDNIDLPIQMSGPPVAANPQDRWVVVMDNRILVVTQDGRVFAHSVSATAIEPAILLSGALVAANPQDRRVLVSGNQLLVITEDGRVFAHPVTDHIEPAFQLSGLGGMQPAPVAANPQDKWVLVKGTQIVVITEDGRVFAHDLTTITVDRAFQLTASVPVAANPQDKWVVVMGTRIMVFTKEEVFRPTRLDGHPLGRSEGAFSGFADGQTIYAFFSLKTWPRGCKRVDGCPHDDGDGFPGGKAFLSMSTDSGRRFDGLTTVSSTKFLFPSPVVAAAEQFPGLPEDLRDQVVFVWGTGREHNEGDRPDRWNQSYPYLAVAPLSGVGEKNGSVFSHEVTDTRVANAIQLDAPQVARNPQDKWVLVKDDQILVITRDGRVFAHHVTDRVEPAVQLGGRGGEPPPPVAANPEDKWVVVRGNQLLVITEDGRVFAHTVTDHIEPAFQIGSISGGQPPPVAASRDDNWVLTIGNRILVIRQDGAVFAHDVTDTAIGRAVVLGGALVGRFSQDRRVLGMGNRILVITGNGDVYAHNVTSDKVEGPVLLSGPTTTRGVATNPWDRWVLPLGSPGSQIGSKLLVLPYWPARWRYFAGMTPTGQPSWTSNEALAQPVRPFGQEGQSDFHKCLGYFSVRYFEAAAKWVMLYTCAYPRGVFYRTASLPWGPWSSPELILRPTDAYCHFMYNRRSEECVDSLNPLEESVRDAAHLVSDHYTERGWGGEYAPFLLPSRYARIGNNGLTTVFYLLSTWNPYQVVLMRTQIRLSP